MKIVCVHTLPCRQTHKEPSKGSEYFTATSLTSESTSENLFQINILLCLHGKMKIQRVLAIHIFFYSFHHIHLLPGFQKSQVLSSALIITGFQILLIHSHHPKLEGRVLGLDQCGRAVAQQRQHMLLSLVWHNLTSKAVLALCAHTAAWSLCWQWTPRLEDRNMAETENASTT